MRNEARIRSLGAIRVRLPLLDGQRIRHVCPTCNTRFDPKTRTATFTNGWTGEQIAYPGGITFRFAVRIDCHKGWPRGRGPITLRPELRDLIASVLDEPCEDVGGLS